MEKLREINKITQVYKFLWLKIFIFLFFADLVGKFTFSFRFFVCDKAIKRNMLINYAQMRKQHISFNFCIKTKKQVYYS